MQYWLTSKKAKIRLPDDRMLALVESGNITGNRQTLGTAPPAVERHHPRQPTVRVENTVRVDPTLRVATGPDFLLPVTTTTSSGAPRLGLLSVHSFVAVAGRLGRGDGVVGGGGRILSGVFIY